MGVLLREALRTMCVKNQWCYAVFWKMGCQNSSMLIWEECYHETSPSLLPPRISGFSATQIDTRGSDNVPMLTNRMMLNNRIILVGEGLVGRAAFTGHHQWILVNNFNRDVHPPEVVNEMLLQFSAGIQTVVVIPVVPHGVVQLGSSLPIMENLGFVSEVKGLILQLGCVPGALLSENYRTQESADLIGVPVSRIIPSQAHKFFEPSDLVTETGKQHFSSSEPNIQSELQVEVSGHLVNEQTRCANLGGASEGWQNAADYLSSKVASSNCDEWLNETSPTFNPGAEQRIPTYTGFHESDANLNVRMDCSIPETCGDISSTPSCGSDLFDILNLDGTKNACEDGWRIPRTDSPEMKTETLTREFSNLMIIQETGRMDHLLEAVVSGACSSSKQISGDTSESRRNKVINPSVNTMADNSFHGGFTAIPKTEKEQGMQVSAACLLPVFGQDHSFAACSQTTPVNVSQISSWVEQAHSLKREGNVSTGYPRNETPKPAHRKRLKPRENPRPRPKDRQMIQDRVKELREIIPNGQNAV